MPTSEAAENHGRNWPEDLHEENGNYSNTCVICKALFRGHKRRVLCSLCAQAKPLPNTLSPQEEHEPAISLIQHERRRQIEVEKWSHESDDLLHKRGDLADAAACYAKVAAMISYPGPVPLELPSCWPWAREWWKPSSDPIRNLVKSAALIVAEIERLQRKATLDAQACPSRSPTREGSEEVSNMIVECGRCSGSGYMEACFECSYCGGCGTVVVESPEPDDNLDEWIEEVE